MNSIQASDLKILEILTSSKIPSALCAVPSLIAPITIFAVSSGAIVPMALVSVPSTEPLIHIFNVVKDESNVE